MDSKHNEGVVFATVGMKDSVELGTNKIVRCSLEHVYYNTLVNFSIDFDMIDPGLVLA